MHQVSEEIVAGLESIAATDRLTALGFDECPAVIHEDHRYSLAVCRQGQLLDRLGTPSDLVLFDYHSDFCDINHSWHEELRGKLEPPSLEQVVEFCISPARNRLSAMDDDWIKAGMDLGIVGNMVAFGVFENDPVFNNTFSPRREYLDTNNRVHTIWFLRLPSSELMPTGALLDKTRRPELSELWDCLGWSPEERFRPGKRKFFLSIDLDCFSFGMNNGEFFAWPERAFGNEFLSSSASSKRFVRELSDRAGVLDIVREPNCCGSVGDAEAILHRLDAYVFDGELTFG